MDFSLETLTAAINELPHLPTQLGDSGLFEYDGVATLSIDIEKEGHTLSLVPTAARGAPGSAIGRSSRNVRPFRLAHLPLGDQIFADEVQGVRAFGTTGQAEPLQARLNKVLQIGVQRLDYTLEHMRVGALKGIVYDSDGTTALHNFFTEFGVSQNTLDMVLDSAATEVRAKCDEVLDLISDELGGQMFTGAVCWSGKDFWRTLITHKTVKESYLGQAEAAQLRGAMPDSFDFGGITFRKYRGKVSGSDMIGTNDGYVVPTGVPGLLIGRFGPANYNETVNTMGLPMYAKGIEKRNGTGWDVEMQSNPIHVLTRPRAVVKVTV